MVMALDANDRIACFGSRELTFRAWVVDPGVGYGGTCLVVTPTWLQEWVLPDWLLAPGKTSHAQLHALKRPDATGNLRGVSRWVGGRRSLRRPGRRDMPTAYRPGLCGPAAGGLVRPALSRAVRRHQDRDDPLTTP